MSIVEQTRPEVSHEVRQRSRAWVVFVLLGLVLLFVGGVAGWLIRGGDDGSTPQYVVPGGAALTERQREMVSMVEEYAAAWRATDGEGVASFMTAGGYVQYPEDNMIYRVSDGTLQARVTNGPYSTIHALAPMTVYDDRIVLSGRIDSMSLNWLSVVRFTAGGDVRIMSETIFH